MTIVAFDTSTVVLSVSVSWTDETRGEKQSLRSVLDVGLYHGERLAATVGDLLARADKTMHDVELVACTEGPGSFTGLRIGMATAKGFAAASGVPFQAVPTLDVWAELHRWWPGICVPVIDAKKKRFYAAVYAGGRRRSADLDADPRTIMRDAHASHQEKSREGPHTGQDADLPILISGPDAERFRSACDPEDWAPAHGPEPLCADPRDVVTAGALARLAEHRFHELGAGETGAGPRYVRKSDAEIGRELGGTGS